MPSKFDIHFFKTANGREPVQEFLKHLIHSKNSTDKALADEILTYLMLLSEKVQLSVCPILNIYVIAFGNCALKTIELFIAVFKGTTSIYCTILKNNHKKLP